ncbi:hypothetical protein Tco_0222300 [Tanacetum coccineum]
MVVDRCRRGICIRVGVVVSWGWVGALGLGLDDGVAASFQRSRIHKPHAHTQAFKVNHSNVKIVDSNLPHHQRASKSNKESSIGEIVRLIITYVKQECNKYEHVGQEHKIMHVTRQGANDAMTPESIQSMIDRAIQRNSSQDDGSQSSGGGIRRHVQPARVCSYPNFMKCQPLNFKGTEGVVGLSQWLKKMESVFHISSCAIENQVKFAT